MSFIELDEEPQRVHVRECGCWDGSFFLLRRAYPASNGLLRGGGVSHAFVTCSWEGKREGERM